jgi:radical SAM protein with 4Fe4S-binding SPASM domain
MDGSSVPIIRSIISLRKESFGGFVFNPYLPPETRLDNLRFNIATHCNGGYTLDEIKDAIGRDLDHTPEYISNLVENTINLLEQYYALYWREEKLERPRILKDRMTASAPKRHNDQLSAPLFVIWEITGSCNLKCDHCLSDSGKPFVNELSTDEAKSVIDALVTMKVFNINFSGGEPLIRPDIFELLEYASNKNMAMDLLTNGTLISEKILDRLENTNIFNVQVSLDGLRGTHDDFRGIKATFDRAVRAVSLLIDRDFNVSISSAVTKKNINEIPEIIDLAIDLGARNYKTTLFMPAGRGKGNVDEYVLSPLEAKDFVAMLNEMKKELGNKISISCEELYPWLNGTSKEDITCSNGKRKSTVGCTAGNSSLYIMPDGRIAPCPFLREFVAGESRKQDLQEIWDSAPLFDVFRNIKGSDLGGKCGECEFLGLSCFGGCRAAAFAHTGDLYAEDPLCWKQ